LSYEAEGLGICTGRNVRRASEVERGAKYENLGKTKVGSSTTGERDRDMEIFVQREEAYKQYEMSLF
jgi:hypothetical protein